MNNLDTLPKKKILSLFMTCGFPTLNHSKKIFNEMLSHQPDIIEFGLPFSDPMADGPIIQEANKLALRSKLSTQQSLNLIKELSKSKNNTSFVIMCYLNTVRKFGLNKFIKNIKSIVDGIIIVDLPFEEEGAIKKSLSKNNIHLIKLISPMTDKKRSQKLLKSFLNYRHSGYSKRISSPLTAEQSGSRLSPHLSFGSISIRDIYQNVDRRISKAVGLKKQSLNSFQKRLVLGF